MKRLILATSLLATVLAGVPSAHASPMKALIVDGQNNHDWKTTTPILKKYLEESGLFAVDVATSPPKGGDMSTFKPRFKDYKVIISNYNGEPWSRETEDDFAKFVKAGGGFVSYHAANNAFPDWKEYNEMIGIGGWGNRTEKAGPYVRFVEGKIIKDSAAGRGGSHGAQHEFLVEIRDSHHPITAGLPEKWMHTKDELYDRLRGPAENLTVLATAYSSPDTKGSGNHEPMLMTISYGKGRVFHTTLGHAKDAVECVGFVTTFLRGAEWAATGKVTFKVPANFPTSDKVSRRE